MNTPPIVIVDTDAIVAQVHVEDTNHTKSIQITKKLLDLKARVIYPASAVIEAVTVLQHKLNKKAVAYETAKTLILENAEITEINSEVLFLAVNSYFTSKTSKKNTLFDCVVAATAKSYGADAIFSFDRFYKSKGFKLAADL